MLQRYNFFLICARKIAPKGDFLFSGLRMCIFCCTFAADVICTVKLHENRYDEISSFYSVGIAVCANSMP